MIVAQIADSGQNEYYTKPEVVRPLLKYTKPEWTIWCPFSKEESEYVKIFKKNGNKVINTHIDLGQDFFNLAKQEFIELYRIDAIIDNPPFTEKTKILKTLFKLDVPFAMLFGLVGLFESQERFNLFKNNRFEMMYFNLRMKFKGQKSNPPFSCGYVCHDLLPEPRVWEELKKDD